MKANPVALTVFLLLFALVASVGFVASRWRKADLHSLHEWGLGGRSFGTLLTWFLMGGDLYTAYTFIAVPALIFGAGATGFFAVPYTVMVYPLLFLFYPRLWSVARKHGYVTAADFVRGRFGNRPLAVAVALTGIIATVPYVALQLAGMQVVIAAMGIPTTWNVAGIAVPNLPLIVAFAVLAAYTYSSGLRGTALTAIVKDLLIYATVVTAVIVIPAKLGGYGRVFNELSPKTLLVARGTAGNLGGGFAYSSLAVGSMLALFLYPHAITGLLGAGSRQAIKRNSIILPAYSLALALLALLGYAAVAAGVKSMPEYATGFGTFGNNFAIPALFLHAFPSWFTGVAFAAIAIGALVPASIMAIASGSLFTRNIYKEFISPDCTPAKEARVAKLASLTLKVFALVFVLMLQTTYAIQLQLLGGIWICQTLPAVLIALYTRFFHPYALLAGWAVGVATGTFMAWTLEFKSSIYVLHLFGLAVPCYAALSALVLNLAVAAILSAIHGMVSNKPKNDETDPLDYLYSPERDLESGPQLIE